MKIAKRNRLTYVMQIILGIHDRILFSRIFIGYSTFCSYPPEVVKEMPKKVLVKEVQRLQLALEEQTEMANHSQQLCDRLKNERILCRICFERDICIVLLPCRHHVLCEPCSNKCQSCPICRLTIECRLSVYDAVLSANPLCDAV